MPSSSNSADLAPQTGPERSRVLSNRQIVQAVNAFWKARGVGANCRVEDGEIVSDLTGRERCEIIKVKVYGKHRWKHREEQAD